MLLGYWDDGNLRYVGHAGSGLDDRGLAALYERLSKLHTPKCPFAKTPPRHRPTTWVKPELVAEVNFADWTPDGHLRAPVFLRLRDDVKSRSARDGPRAEGGHERHAAPVSEIEQVLEQLEDKSNRIDLQVGAARIRLTNLDREYWPAAPRARPPAITKRDLLRYLVRVSPYVLPHLEDRC